MKNLEFTNYVAGYLLSIEGKVVINKLFNFNVVGNDTLHNICKK